MTHASWPFSSEKRESAFAMYDSTGINVLLWPMTYHQFGTLKGLLLIITHLTLI